MLVSARSKSFGITTVVYLVIKQLYVAAQLTPGGFGWLTTLKIHSIKPIPPPYSSFMSWRT